MSTGTAMELYCCGTGMSAGGCNLFIRFIRTHKHMHFSVKNLIILQISHHEEEQIVSFGLGLDPDPPYKRCL